MVHFLKNSKKVKNEVKGTEKHRFWNLSENFPQIHFLVPVTSILTFFQFSQKCAGLY